MESDTCKECGKWTDQGIRNRQEYDRLHPLSGIDFSKPLSFLIEDIRNQMIVCRSQLNDIKYTGKWESSIDDVTGLLTCGLIDLWHIKDEMETWEKKEKGKTNE